MTVMNEKTVKYLAAGNGIYQNHIKRLLDLGLALLLFIPALPIVLIAAAFIKAESKGPVFFSQVRVGRNCQQFRIYKLRTMKSETHDQNGTRLRDTERITKTGALIRKLSVDELPQLLNIIKGEMSFIGPRPLYVRYLPYYTKVEIKRHDVLPGITGLAQINGRNILEWEKRFAYDLTYVETLSFGVDVQILLKTVLKVLKGSGTSVVLAKDFPDLDEYRGSLRGR